MNKAVVIELEVFKPKSDAPSIRVVDTHLGDETHQTEVNTPFAEVKGKLAISIITPIGKLNHLDLSVADL